jgi:hypothetical protein
MFRLNAHNLFVCAALAALLGGCTGAGPADAQDNDPPLANADELLDGVPKADDIGREFKGDEVLPTSFTDIRETQSPVQSQGRRGVCSIFSTVGLMEHLYIKEGTITDPDFSEQYLQWSAKFQVGSFPNSSGSNANSNLRAINRFGIPAEAAWPYEPSQWGAADDPACEGDEDLPTRCYTNGEPPSQAVDAQKFFLPRSRFLHFLDIKSHMFNRQTGVVAGMTFFYQSWNHRRSQLPTNSDYWNEGIVLAPNSKDREISLEKRAGHSILLIGWDDDMEVQSVDENGELVVDDNGDPVMQKGFYLFKNSWGTSGFGISNPHGAGYGWIAYDYVHEFASIRISDVPDMSDFTGAEVCDDGEDNDNNGDTDCDDAACIDAEACQAPGGDEVVFTSEEAQDIPDNTQAGVSSTIRVSDPGRITNLSVDVDIEHSFRGDLRVSLQRGSTSVTLHNRDGGGADDLVASFDVDDFDGEDMQGEWNLVVTDEAALDTGRLRSWSLRITAE